MLYNSWFAYCQYLENQELQIQQRVLFIRFDPHTRQWSFVAAMSTSRSTVGVAVLDGKLYAVGGRDGCSCLNSAEVYDPHTNKWTMISSMIHRRGGKFHDTVLSVTS